MDVLKELGVVALGSRLKRLLERLNKDVSRFYRTLDLDFQPHWFSTLYLLGRQSPMTVTGIAESLGYTHPAVVKLAAQMTRAGLVSSYPGCDRRERRLALTGKGRRMIVTLKPVWENISRHMARVIVESGHDLVAALDAVEAGLDRQSLLERLTGIPAFRFPDDVEILDYRPAFKNDFERLNREWIEGHFKIEKSDEAMLSNPDGTIIRKGGAIFFAKRKETIVGTCALIKHPGGVWELAKMAVTEQARGRRVGTALAVSAARRARELGAERLCLETSPTDTRAMAFLRALASGKRDVIGSRPDTAAPG